MAGVGTDGEKEAGMKNGRGPKPSPDLLFIQRLFDETFQEIGDAAILGLGGPLELFFQLRGEADGQITGFFSHYGALLSRSHLEQFTEH